jgi:hypothetical protein
MKNWIAVLALGFLAACGGGGGSTSSTPLSGSVSQGFPIAGASVTLIDAKGTELSAGTTDSEGNYTVPDISSLTAPIMVKASGTAGGYPVTLYGLLSNKSSSNVANVTPLTDAVLTQAIGSSPTLLLNEPSRVATINTATVSAVANRFTTALSNVLDQITPGASQTFNPMSTPFVANGSHAADKVNDLIKVASVSTVNGVETDLIDKSNTVGIVTVTNEGTVDRLERVPSSVASVSISQLKKTVDMLTAAFASETTIESAALENLFTNDFLDDGLNKVSQVREFRSFKSLLAGTVVTNPRVNMCKTGELCSLRLTLKGPVLNQAMDVWAKYDATKGYFLLYGNQYKFKAQVDSHVHRSVNLSNNNVTTQAALSVVINNQDTFWNTYETAKAEFVGPNGTADLTYLYRLKPNDCYPNKPGSFYYDGMPRDDASTQCWHGQMFDTNNEQQLKDINAKIKRGGYKVIVKAWKNSTRSGEPDIVEIPLVEPLATTDRIAEDGYPMVTRRSGAGNELPYLQIDNADDFVVTGSLCLSKRTWCNVEMAEEGSTTTQPNGQPKLARKIQASRSDGWSAGDPIRAFFVHVMDKAGRDLILSGYSNN